MRQPVKDILEIAKYVRKEFIKVDNRKSIKKLRNDAKSSIASKRRVTPGTIGHSYIRSIEPFTKGSVQFDRLLNDWLTKGSDELYQILLKLGGNSLKPLIDDVFLSGTNSNVLDQIDEIMISLENSPTLQEQFNPSNVTDARERTLNSIVQRRGQAEFRQELLKAYEFKCAISECNVPEALEASHIIPYLGPKTNQLQNGILLRADIHTLFDLRLLSIDEDSYRVIISSKLKNTHYAQYEGKLINLPSKIEFRPSRDALKRHRNESNLVIPMQINKEEEIKSEPFDIDKLLEGLL